MTAMPEDTQRLDKWLWCARIFKTRALAAKAISGKGVRITRNGRTDRTGKPGFSVRPGDTVTFTKEKSIRILEITGLAERRGPAAEAQKLYIDHSEILSQKTPPTEQRTFMLDKLFARFRPSEDVVEDESANLKNAVAALLVEAARADEEYTDEERVLIDDMLKAQFSLTSEEALALRTSAEEAQAAANDMYGFSRVVKQDLDRDGKMKLIEDMWVIALSDAEKAPYEEMIIRRLIGLIYLEDSDSAVARQRAAARLGQ